MWRFILGSVETGSDIIAFFSRFLFFNWSLLRDPKVGACSFRSLAFSSSSWYTKFGTSFQITLHSPKKDQSWVMFADSFNQRRASVVWDADPRYFGRIMCPWKKMFLQQICFFFVFSVTSVLQRDVSTVWTWTTCSCKNLVKITVLGYSTSQTTSYIETFDIHCTSKCAGRVA